MVMDDPTLPRIKVRDLLMQAFLTGWERSDKSTSQDEYLQSSIQVIEMLQVEPENLYAEEGLGLPDGEEVDHLDDLLRADGQWLYYGVEKENFFLIQWYPDKASAEAKLAELKPNVVKTWTSANDTINMLNQGEISVAVLLDYSYTTAKNANPDYIWVDPAEGSFSGYNMLNIVKGCENKELAEAFIDYYLSYDVQLAEALDGVDAPVRPDVELTAEQAANFTYGEDMIANLKLPDWNVIAANQANWIASWNAIFSVK